MGIPLHTFVAPDGANGFTQSGYASLGLLLAVGYPAAAAGVTSTQTVTFPASANLPANYGIFIDSSAGDIVFVTNRTSTGFTLNVQPGVSGTGVVAAGTVNVMVIA